ncbi:MAG: prepilin-type N-terminal cleavage/methylation domain-containing protein [Armatimonadota bacterium]|nr:MAG: prepilin-type N-terminal cleavage/methylation domain-containing protein [Armatimonadota bacterium]
MINRRSGFTLIELLVTIVILAIGLVALSTLFVAGIISDIKAERIQIATNRARQELERMRSAGYSGALIHTDIFKPADGYSITESNPDLTGIVSFAEPLLPASTGSLEIRYYDSGAGIYPNLKRLSVTLAWGGGKRTQGAVFASTLLANRP